MRCPVCRTTRFYVAAPDDPMDLIPFEYDGPVPVFDEDAQPLEPESIIHCDACSWHGRVENLLK